ncbi:MAG: HPP family protein [Candidatus Hadarchaeaceae archaeon]
MVEPNSVGLEFYELQVQKIMQRRDVPIIEKDAPIDRILNVLLKKTHVWVTEGKKSKKIIGVITEHDVLSILSPRKAPYVFGLPDLRALHWGTAESIMHRRLVKCGPKDTIRNVLTKMREHGIRRLPVTKRNNIIVGEIRLFHIIKRYSAALKELK